MIVIACYNIKGGVGKTAAAVNLAWLSAQDGTSTLVWDLDPQGAASFYFRIKPKVKGGGKGLIRGKCELDDLIKATDFPNLDLLPADFSYRNMDLLLDDAKKPTRNLKKRLKPLAETYERVFLDCPPSISLVSENVFHATDILLTPLIPSTLSLRTLEQIRTFIAEQKLRNIRLWPFISMIDRRKKLHLETAAALPTNYPDALQTAIPYASEVERMGTARAPLGEFAPKGSALHAYRDLWQEIRTRLE